jgi:diadenylate cyclase
MKDFILQTWAIIKAQILDVIFLVFGEMDLSIFDKFQMLIDILLVATIIYLVLRFIVRIHALHIFVSALIFSLLLFVSESLNLIASQIVLQGFLLLLLVTIPIMFQHELRHSLERIGYSPFHFFKKSKYSLRHKLIKSVKQASSTLSEKRHGALIAIEQTSPLGVYAETGVPLGAEISKEILLNIFFPKSPLHDGAIIIKNNIILAAGAVLPLTHSTPEYQFGTRHKSALGLAEATDAIVVIISEERGEVSLAHKGEIIPRVDEEFLEDYLKKHIKK